MAAERTAVERLQSNYDVGHHASAAAEHAAVVPDSLVDRTASEVRTQLIRVLDQPGVDRVILNPQITSPGAKPLGTVPRELETEVLP